ncbi:MAG: DUF362 domain-containing protein [Bryobacteraceae bacterium]
MKPPKISRRVLLFGTAASTVVLCRCKSKGPLTDAHVSVVKARAYSDDLFDLVRRLFVQHRLAVKGKRVVLKPNLVEFDAASTINTHPLVVHAALEAVRALGAAEVRIAEGPGHRRLTLDLAEEAGYFSTIPKFEDLFTDLNLDQVARRKFLSPISKLSELYLPHTVLGCDLLISLPKMKTHHWAGATLSMKNLFGMVPGGVYGWPKNVLHWAGIHECIADLHRTVRNGFALVDGIDAMEGNGPIQGKAKHMGVLVAGKDMVAVDATCCNMMEIDAGKVEYLRLADISRRRIHQLAENPAKLRTRFELVPSLDALRLA